MSSGVQAPERVRAFLDALAAAVARSVLAEIRRVGKGPTMESPRIVIDKPT
jgi:hypothetical protein